MKKTLIIILILIIILGGFLYIRGKKTATQSGEQTSGFKSFFNFGSKPGTTGQNPDNETSGEFTTENPDGTTGSGTTTPGGASSSTSVFGTSGPFNPTAGGDISGGGGITGGGIAGGGEIEGGGGTGGGGGVTGGGGGGGTGGGGSEGGTNQCTDDDTVIEFTPEEIARLRALEDRFYALAPTLRSDADVQAEIANYSSYKLLNQKYAELITYCENKSPLLPDTTNRRVATPLYTNASANTYFVDGPDADGIIDMQSSTPKLKEIEQFFRISIW